MAHTWLRVPPMPGRRPLPGFSVTEYATGLTNPRLVRTAPNGDLFVAESEPGQIRVLRGVDAHGHAEKMEVYATGLAQPFGLASIRSDPIRRICTWRKTPTRWCVSHITTATCRPPASRKP